MCGNCTNTQQNKRNNHHPEKDVNEHVFALHPGTCEECFEMRKPLPSAVNMMNLLTDAQETVEVVPHATRKPWNPVETSATFTIIALQFVSFYTPYCSGLIHGALIRWFKQPRSEPQMFPAAVSNESPVRLRELHPTPTTSSVAVPAAHVREQVQFLIHLTWPETLSAARLGVHGRKVGDVSHPEKESRCCE